MGWLPLSGPSVALDELLHDSYRDYDLLYVEL